jgi:hypothetical protein
LKLEDLDISLKGNMLVPTACAGPVLTISSGRCFHFGPAVMPLLLEAVERSPHPPTLPV